MMYCAGLSLAFAQDTGQNESKKPKAVYKVGTAQIAVWENKLTGPNGDFTKKSFKVEKRYLKGGEWKSTSYFDEAELLELRAALDKAISEEQVTKVGR